MLALAAARLGLKTHIFCPDPESPAFDVTPRKTVAAYDDEAALAAFADAVDVVTYEFENVPARDRRVPRGAEDRCGPARGPWRSRRTGCRRRRSSRSTASRSPPSPPSPTRQRCSPNSTEVGLPAVLKTTRLGYDGKGQRTIRDAADGEAAFAALEPKPLVLEAFVAVREGDLGGRRARARRRDRVPMRPRRTSTATTSSRPAPCRPTISAATAEEAHRLAAAIVDALDYVGRARRRVLRPPGRQAARQRDRAARPQFRATGPKRSASPTSSSSTSGPSPAGRSAIRGGLRRW